MKPLRHAPGALLVGISLLALATACSSPASARAPRSNALPTAPASSMRSPDQGVTRALKAGESFPAATPSSLPAAGMPVDVDPADVRVVLGSPPDPTSNAIVYLTVPSYSDRIRRDGARPTQVTAHVQIYDQRGVFQVDPARFVFLDAAGDTHAALTTNAVTPDALGSAQLHPQQSLIGDVTFDSAPRPGRIELLDSDGTTICFWTVVG